MIISYIILKYLSIMQDKLIFKPIHNEVNAIKTASEHNLENTQDVYITTDDDVKLHLWHHKSTNTKAPTFIIFHGNTGNWVDVGKPDCDEEYQRDYRLQLLQEIINQEANFIAVSMRGFGNSAKIQASESGFSLDLNTVLKYLHNQNITPNQTIILGESLGGGVAYMMAEKLSKLKTPPKILATIALFASMAHRVKQDYPSLNIDDINKKLRHKFNSIARTQNLDKHIKLQLFHGLDDITTLPYHSKLLYDEAKQYDLDVELFEMQSADHLNWDMKYIINKILKQYE